MRGGTVKGTYSWGERHLSPSVRPVIKQRVYQQMADKISTLDKDCGPYHARDEPKCGRTGSGTIVFGIPSGRWGGL